MAGSRAVQAGFGSSAALNWHDERRRAGVPVLSVLRGPTQVGVRSYRRWARSHGYAFHPLPLEPEVELEQAWLAAFGAHPAMRPRALEVIANALGMAPQEVARHADSHSRDAVLLFERATAIGDERTGAVSAELSLACAVLGQAVRRSRRFEISQYVKLLGSEFRLAMLLVIPEPNDKSIRQLRQTVELVERTPRLVVGATIGAQHLEWVLRGADARWKALLREGLIDVVDDEPMVEDGGASGLPEAAAHERRKLIESGADAAVLRLFDSAARVAPVGPAGDARSHYEALLFEVLDGHPETAGLFELNGRLEFAFGPRPAEVDLLCRQLALAIEIDGFYHFTGEAAWRRDRRKDLLLQQHGYQVMRCLAADIVQRLTELVSRIRAVVRQRRQAIQERWR